MTAAQIEEILAGTFETEEDRKYWEEKLAEIIRKESNYKENLKKRWR